MNNDTRDGTVMFDCPKSVTNHSRNVHGVRDTGQQFAFLIVFGL